MTLSAQMLIARSLIINITCLTEPGLTGSQNERSASNPKLRDGKDILRSKTPELLKTSGLPVNKPEEMTGHSVSVG